VKKYTECERLTRKWNRHNSINHAATWRRSTVSHVRIYRCGNTKRTRQGAHGPNGERVTNASLAGCALPAGVRVSDLTVRMLAANTLIGIPQALRRWGRLFELELQRGDHA
jgi:hypothetical protein